MTEWYHYASLFWNSPRRSEGNYLLGLKKEKKVKYIPVTGRGGL
jgi:hypothetical protein